MAIVGLSLFGALISAYLTWVYYSGAEARCTGVGGCETVQSSRYSVLAGVPVALLGLVLYVIIAASMIVTLPIGREWIALARFGLALAGTLYSVYLTYLELFVIAAICPWCVTSALLLLAILALALREVIAPSESEQPASVNRRRLQVRDSAASSNPPRRERRSPRSGQTRFRRTAGCGQSACRARRPGPAGR